MDNNSNNSRFDPLRATFELVAKIMEYSDLQQPIAALDSVNRILYGYLQKLPSEPYYLVGINVDSGEVVSQAVGGQCTVTPNSQNCPWSLHFYSGVTPV